MANGTCSSEGCEKPIYARSLCATHYDRLKRRGNMPPLPGPQRPRQFREMIERETDDCVLWPYARTSGYGEMTVGGQSLRLHVLACEQANGPRPSDGRWQVAHSCGRRACINPRHLRWATPAENNADKLEHGTDHRGAKSPLAKLTESDVRAMRDMYAGGEWTLLRLASHFGVSKSTAHRTVNRKRWAWLD